MNKYQIERFLRNAKNNFNYHLRNIPVVTRYLLISIIVVFILQHVVNLYFFVLQSFNYGFNPVQLISYAFLHGNFAHLLFNGLALWMFGSQIERYWGAKRYLTFVFVCTT